MSGPPNRDVDSRAFAHVFPSEAVIKATQWGQTAPEFKPVVGFEAYRVDRRGRVIHGKTGRLLTTSKDKAGYWTVTLRAKDGPKRVRVADLVAVAWCGSLPAGWAVVFRDGHSGHHAADNLRVIREEPPNPASTPGRRAKLANGRRI